MLEACFVTFYSPGTFVAEVTTKPIDSWDIDKAVEMSKYIKERHGALPYGFQFTKRSREDNDMDSKETERSHMYYLGGVVKTLDDVKAENNYKNKTLICNMENNDWDRIIVNTNSYTWTQPLKDGDVVLDIK